MKEIVLAGGCFWGVEAYFKLVNGVVDTRVGYIDGKKENPTYEEVCSGSGHAEAVWVQYDENTTSIKKLLDHYFNIVDPTMFNRQGPDIGVQYRSGIYNYNEAQKEEIDAYIESIKSNYNRPIIIAFKTDLPFYLAETYHQDYLDKNKNGYCHVNLSSVKNVK
ncbi:peptide-methionine (S)-S-oxide reductase MsrA [Liberiplasma polymorphum]|uniref:peptide-methionine (S)-S-oxide reductase MsrA n=1 Tax=Liberiplasma polymorphum TaxID=3374570 RepID=UPI003771CF75